MRIVQPGEGTFRGQKPAGIEIPPEWNVQGIDRSAALRKSAPSAGQEPSLVEAMAEFGDKTPSCPINQKEINAVKFPKNSENTQLSGIKQRQSVHANTGRKARRHQWITHTMGRALAILLALALVVTLVSSAKADSCKNVDIKLDNQTSVRVKALYANFKCEGENEKKELFKNVEVPEMTKLPVATQQDLQSCKGKKMNYIEVHYKVRCGDGSWSNEKFIKDSSFLNPYCSSDAGKEYTVVLPADNAQATCN